MASFRFSTALLLIAVVISAATAAAEDYSVNFDSVSPPELEAMCRVLRFSGYNLFCNAIATSDLQVQLDSAAANATAGTLIAAAGKVFTLFAPKNTFLYTLDMASDAADYVAALRYHVVPNRLLTLSDLHNLSSPFLETLLPHYSVLIYKNDNGSVTVDGVRVSDPDLFLGSSIAVHGLDGILLNGYSRPFEDCVGDDGLGFISPEDFISPHICHSSPPATTPSPTLPPSISPENSLNPPPTPALTPSPVLKPTLAPPISSENSLNPAPTQALTPTPVVKPTLAPPISPENSLNQPPTSSPAPTPVRKPTLAPPISPENSRRRGSRNVRQGKRRRSGIRSIPRIYRRRYNRTKAKGDDDDL